MKSEEGSQPVLSVLSQPRVIIALLSATMGAYSIGTIEATLSPYLEHLSMDVKVIAMTFLTMSLCSVLGTPLCGLLCDGKMSPWIVTSCGFLLMFLCFAFLGPAPYLPMDPTIYSVQGALVLQGLGSAGVLVASFVCALQAAVTTHDNTQVQAVVSGLFTAAFAFGNFWGPTVSGILYDAVGFRYNCLVLQGFILLFIIFNIVSYILTYNNRHLVRPDIETMQSTTTQLTQTPDIIPPMSCQRDQGDKSQRDGESRQV